MSKSAFVAKALANYNQSVIVGMRNAAKRMGVGVTNEGLQSLAYKMYANGDGQSSSLSFHEYLRMVDMGAGRGHPLGGLTKTLVTLQASNKSGFAFKKDTVRKPKKFYSPTIYSQLNFLQNELLYGYTEEVIALLKAEMQSKPIN